MECPYCRSWVNRVLDSRARGGYVYRRRACFDCGRRFTTEERLRWPQEGSK